MLGDDHQCCTERFHVQCPSCKATMFTAVCRYTTICRQWQEILTVLVFVIMTQSVNIILTAAWFMNSQSWANYSFEQFTVTPQAISQT